MARGVRKAASDSVTQQLKDVRAQDRTAATAPRDVEGVEHLQAVGLRTYDQLYRTRPDWTYADLSLIVMAAQSADRIEELNRSIMPGMTIIDTKTTKKIHPAIPALNEQRRVYSNLLRDASVRQRDAKRDSAAARAGVPTPETHTEAQTLNMSSGEGFDAWLTKQ